MTAQELEQEIQSPNERISALADRLEAGDVPPLFEQIKLLRAVVHQMEFLVGIMNRHLPTHMNPGPAAQDCTPGRPFFPDRVVLPGMVMFHDRPGTTEQCRYLASKYCNNCGWWNPEPA